MEFADLPHDILLAVFKMCPQMDRVKGRRLNKRIHQVLTTRGAPKLLADEFKVSAVDFDDRCTPIGRLNLKKSHKSHKTRRIVSVSVRRHKRVEKLFETTSNEPTTSTELQIHRIVDAQLEQVKIGSRLAFEGSAMCCDRQLLESLLLNDLRSVRSLSFTMCHVKWSSSEFSQLIAAASSPLDLVFDFCHFHTDLLTDKVLAQVPSLGSLNVQGRGWVRFPSLTDATLHRWASTPTPRAIRLSNVIAGFSLEGIRHFIQNVQFDESFDMELGLLPEGQTNAEALAKILLSPRFSAMIGDEYLSRRVSLMRSKSLDATRWTPFGGQETQKITQKISFSIYVPQINSE